METVALEDGGIRPRQGFDAWNRDGKFGFRTMSIATVFRRRAAYFRVNATGKIYRVISRFKTVEVRAGRRAGDTAA